MSDSINIVKTSPYDDQKPGTSGLRKKVIRFKACGYLENFVQSVFDVIPHEERRSLVVGGDGRYFNQYATQTIVRMAVANGFREVIVGQNALLSTPAVSNLIRKRHATGGIVLSASHNPGGPSADFGIKFNNSNGSPAPQEVTDRIFENTQAIQSYRITDSADIELASPQLTQILDTKVEVVDSVSDYLSIMQKCFDFDLLRSKFNSGDLSICFDAMHAVTGPYAREILVDVLGAEPDSVHNATPLEDFGGGHPDPNLVHAHELVDRMGRDRAAMLGAASDGDGDRNLILGPGCFITPSDSLALLTAHAGLIPQFKSGLAGVARSMPTSCAVDRVAEKMNIPCYETPTGWKFFGNLLDEGRINLCGEESFGTGGDHVREKDGLWTVLAWLTILARLEKPVTDIVNEHWLEFGRNVYCRHDFEDIPVDQANAIIRRLRLPGANLVGTTINGYQIERVSEFSYTDPVDQSISTAQGIQVHFAGDSRVVFRLSGTGTSGATLRMYVERYATEGFAEDAIASNQALAQAGSEIAGIEHFTGRRQASVVT